MNNFSLKANRKGQKVQCGCYIARRVLVAATLRFHISFYKIVMFSLVLLCILCTLVLQPEEILAISYAMPTASSGN